MSQSEKTRYAPEELVEFEELILQKLKETNEELLYIKESLMRTNDSGIDGTIGNSKLMEDSADAAEKESLNQLAARLQKFKIQLDKALIRIKNGTYGICVDTGKLIQKERLRIVPHTQHSIEAKKAKM